MKNEYLLIGSVGLDKDAWQTVFYDDDLPADWRAAFYSTLLRSVYLSPQEWQQAIDDNWVDEVDEDFRFVLQAKSASDILDKVAKHNDFCSLVAGVVLECREGKGSWPEKNEIQAIQQLFPVCLDAGNNEDVANSDLEQYCVSAGVSKVWYPAKQAAPLPCGDFLVSFFDDEKLPQQKEIVAQIEQWMKGDRRAALFNSREKDAPLKAQETRVLAELMGV